MECAVRLDREEAEFVARFVADHGLGIREGDALDLWLRMWARFVEEVERGYSLTVYDYANDVSVRTILADLARVAPEALQRKLLTWLRPWDDRFQKATRPIVNPFDPSEPPAALARIARVPVKLVGELKDDLRREGIA